ncbi:Uncharacterised protein [Mycobacteroides abscessus]|nr:Uncharacterised protein [Mycobacteroides abscessus]
MLARAASVSPALATSTTSPAASAVLGWCIGVSSVPVTAAAVGAAGTDVCTQEALRSGPPTVGERAHGRPQGTLAAGRRFGAGWDVGPGAKRPGDGRAPVRARTSPRRGGPATSRAASA